MKLYPIAAAAALLVTPALAQTTAPQTNAPAEQSAPAQQNAPAAKTESMKSETSMPNPASGQWRASKLIGVDVYNQQDEKLGEIDELILTRNGQVAGAVIGVGGFLGMGERNVMVSLDKLKFSNEGASTTGAASDGDHKWYPERAILDANKDQLKQMPEFKY